jgi:hypothetical protein
MSEPLDHVRLNRDLWDAQAADYVAWGRRAWADHEPTWGIGRVPDAWLNVLPDVGHGNAEQVPLADATFDFAISEYGASLWCDPWRWPCEEIWSARKTR